MLGLFIASVLVGCAADPVDRQSKLLTMAAGEAQQIPDSTQRLTRQLNFASVQMSRSKSGEAKQSLAFAAQTLRDAKPGTLKSQIRIAGWVSISELSRQAGDRATAQAACDEAVAILTSLDPVAERPQYVVGVADEVKALQGKAAAAKLLESSVDWIKQLDGGALRRQALVDVADATFDCDDYSGGLAILRADHDAAWRSDTLAMLADRNAIFRDANGNIVETRTGRTLDGVSNLRGAAVPAPFPASAGFSKPVDYRSVFQQMKSQN
jgi:hypothetical protein